MKLSAWMMTGTFSAMFCLGASALALADPHDDDHHNNHRRGATVHRKGFQIVTPLGQVTTRYDQYQYVVPPAQKYGAFYLHDDKRYYTPRHQDDGHHDEQRPVPVEFGGFKHHQELAERLDALSNELCLDLHHNYSQNHGFKDIYREAYELRQAAKFIHDSEHREDHKGIQRSATTIDKLFHHVQAEITDWQSQNQRTIGRYSLAAKMEEMEAVIHHLIFDVGVRVNHGETHGSSQTPTGVEQAPAP